MKLTENELNYILSECVQQLVLEDSTLKDKWGVAKEKARKASNYMGKKFDKFKEPYVDAWKKGSGWGRLENVAGAAARQIPGAIPGMIGGVSALIGGGPERVEGGIDWPALTMIGGGLVIYAGVRGLTGIVRKIQQYLKAVPNNRKGAFNIAVKVAPSYKEAADVCETIKNNIINIIIPAFNQVAKNNGWQRQKISWESIEGELNGVNFTIDGDFNSAKGAQGQVSPHTNFKDYTIKVNESINSQATLSTPQLVEQFTKAGENAAYESVKQVCSEFVKAYQEYYKCRTYIRSIMYKHSISWEEIEKLQLTSPDVGTQKINGEYFSDKKRLSPQQQQQQQQNPYGNNGGGWGSSTWTSST